MNPCYYCGVTASGIDHVVPQKLLRGAVLAGDLDSYFDMTGHGRILEVDSCQQCNSILGAKFDSSLAERKARVKARLKQKLAHDLAMPDWSEDQLNELSPDLRTWVVQGLLRREIARSRINW